MTTRTALLALTAFTALATSALAPNSASAWGDGHFAEPNNPGPGFGGAPNPAATHPSPHVPGATLPSTGGVGCHGLWCRPRNFPSANATPSPTPPAGGSNGPTWGPNGQGGNSPVNKGAGGNGPWPGGNGGEAHPCGYGGCASNGPRPWWHRPGWGPAVYPGQTTYNQAPTYTIPGPIYTAPTYTSSAPTYTAPAPNFAPPAPSYTQAPPQTYTQAPVPTYTQAQPVSQNCNCLTKSYMQDGSVVFTDVCTKETAMAAPAGWQHGQSAQQTNY